MKLILGKIRRFLAPLRAFFPSALPQGKSEFEAYAASVCELYGFPYNDDYSHMVAAMIQHLGADVYRLPKRYFLNHIKKAIANEVAFYIMQDINDRRRKIPAAEKTNAFQGL